MEVANEDMEREIQGLLIKINEVLGQNILLLRELNGLAHHGSDFYIDLEQTAKEIVDLAKVFRAAVGAEESQNGAGQPSVMEVSEESEE